MPFLTKTVPELTALPGMLIMVGLSAKEPALAMAITPLAAHTGNVSKILTGMQDYLMRKKPAPAITSDLMTRAGSL